VQTIVFGSGGLIGSSILRCVPGSIPFYKSIPWEDTDKTEEIFDSWVSPEMDTQVIWAAGASVVGATTQSLEQEMKVFRAFARGLKNNAERIECVLLVSSAGGVYGNASDTKISEKTKPSPISEYGQIKLQQERELEELAVKGKFKLIVARVTNAYGPLQNLTKKQGLISSLVKASLNREPVEIYVPLDTKRDYIYADDIGNKLAKLLEVTRLSPEQVTYKIISSQVNRTISSIIGELNRIRGIRTPVIFATKPETLLQPRDLSFASIMLTEVDTVPCISLAEGMHKVIAKQMQDKQTST
jgi:UDP-glucose 4-epimerase